MTTTEETWLAPAAASVDALPRPLTERWQPLRLGLVDLFYYDDEQFWFHDGRLLLRGNNGTGKSKVLALTLPFLLDGSVAARRVEPDADPKKRMDWNLLLGGAHRHNERTGYSWVEFGRRDAEGTEHFTTLGIGLKAASGRGIVKQWWFTTTRRIGDLKLLDENRTVLSADRLQVELEGTGKVHPSQEAYRRAVDEALFRLGRERYAALIDLLIQLRQPQLSKRPDEKALSAALTEALSPLDQAVVADVAESFRSLQEERDGIADARETLQAADDFLQHYRVYSKVAARRHTTAVRTTNSDYEWRGREQGKAEAERDEAVVEVKRLEVAQGEAEERQASLRGEELALRESPEMRDALRLNEAENAATEAVTRLVGAEADTTSAEGRVQREGAAHADAVARHEGAIAAAAGHDQEAHQRARGAGLAGEHAVIALDRRAAQRAIDRRRKQIAHVRRLAERAEGARLRADQHSQAADVAEGEAAARGEEAGRATNEVVDAVALHRDEVATYLRGLALIAVADPAEDLAAATGAWAASLDGESPARRALGSAVDVVFEGLTRRRVHAEREDARISGVLAAVRQEITELEAGRDPEPSAMPGRDPAARAGAVGGPLWRLVDFAEHVSPEERAGLEAALQSAGLLDAWVFPDGTVETAGDVVLSASGPEPASSLFSALVPAVGPDDEVPVGVVEGVLRRIGLGEASGSGTLWVDSTGRWGSGPTRGAWRKQRAAYVGAGARETHRRELVAGLRVDEAGLVRELEVIGGEADEVRRLLGIAEAERAGYPDDSEHEVRVAHERAAAAGRELSRALEAADAARALAAGSAEVSRAQEAELVDAAGDLGLGTSRSELDDAAAAVSSYAEALVEVRASTQAVTDAGAALGRAVTRLADAGQELASRQAIVRDLRAEAARLRSLADALHATVGASVAELQARLESITAGLKTAVEELEQIRVAQLAVAGQRATSEEKVRQLASRREEAANQRAAAIAALRAFAGTGLLRVALPQLSVADVEVADGWNVTAALAMARSAEHELESTDESEDAWARAQQRVSTALTDLATQMSRRGHVAWVEPHGDVLIVRVRHFGEEVEIDRLAERLGADVAERERLLSAREREILENHLVNEVAGHLHELLLGAERQIDGMNRELASRKTSTGMQLRVRWLGRADGPAGLAAARALMLRSDATWTAEDRSAIGGFLQAQINEVRQADPTGSWQEHLEQALDYRQWHSFAVERWQNGQWRSASGPASGGEKVLAVSVPLFAAAASHYNSAGPLAPRLILLDEAFAGVDDDSRAKSLGLLATFDLDVVMTSEREWGCYPEVPGLAIAQLSRVEGIDAVGVSRWRWDGRRRTRIDETDDAARAGGPTDDDRGQAGTESLFE